MVETLSDKGPDLPILPPFLALGALVIAIVLDWLPLHFLAPPVGLNLQVIAGVVIAIAGIWIGQSAASLFKRSGTNVSPMKPALKVVTSGPYRFTRNPMYVGFILLLLGLSLIFSLEWGVILTPFLWLALDRLVVVREERYLTDRFGDDYRALLSQTRRWL